MRRRFAASRLALRLSLWSIGASAGFGSLALGQTQVIPPKNHYSPAEDVQLGRQAAAEVERQLPVLRDDETTSYIRGVGERLVSAIPTEFRHPEFHYTFQVVNVREINAFALPGGPMFVNRGMIQAAHDEGEIAGVMAHELSHVVLRHGTAQASEATKFEVGALFGAVVGAIIGGRTGSVISQGTRFGLGTWFLRFDRQYERQADIEGSHIMARAGYDPRDMANVFRTIEQEGGPGGPEWLSDHPNPGNRYEYITEEARLLHVEPHTTDTRAFAQVRDHLRSLPPAPSTEEATRNAGGGRSTRGTGGDISTTGVPAPAARYTTYTESNLFRVSVPSNWRELPSTTAVTFAPEGAYGQRGGRSIFTHGVEIGVTRNETHDLRTATEELVDSLAAGNPNLSRSTGYSPAVIGDRRGLRTTLSNVSEATGKAEMVVVFTTTLRDGNLLYAVGVAPREEFRRYEPTFQRIVESLELME